MSGRAVPCLSGFSGVTTLHITDEAGRVVSERTLQAPDWRYTVRVSSGTYAVAAGVGQPIKVTVRGGTTRANVNPPLGICRPSDPKVFHLS
jgi:hypothetical protein